MINRELILKGVTKIDDKLLISKVLDKAEKSNKSEKVTNTGFLDPYERRIIEKAISGIGDFNYAFTGGYTGAERTVLFFCSNFISLNERDLYGNTFKLLSIILNSRGSLTHRDYLGALLGLGIKREKVGDILVGEESCDIVVLSDIADFIKYNLLKVGNVKVDVEIKDINELEKIKPKVKEITAAVASLRIDCVACAGFNISRSRILDFIKGEKVNLNWETAANPSKQIKEGDTLSIRGKGRAVVKEIRGATRKGRISIVLNKYI